MVHDGIIDVPFHCKLIFLPTRDVVHWQVHVVLNCLRGFHIHCALRYLHHIIFKGNRLDCGLRYLYDIISFQRSALPA